MNTPDPTGVELDLTDSEAHKHAQARAVNAEWEAVRHLLHLPDISRLSGIERLVVGDVYRIVRSIRSEGIVSTVLETLERDVAAAKKNADPRITDGEGIAVADFILKQIVYKDLTPEDLRNLVTTEIQGENGGPDVALEGVTIDGAPRDFTVNFTVDPWSKGDPDSIKNALKGKLWDVAHGLGIPTPNFATLPYTITEDDIDAILASAPRTADTQLPRSAIRLRSPHDPTGNTDVLVNVQGILSSPVLADENASIMATKLHGNNTLLNQVFKFRSVDPSRTPKPPSSEAEIKQILDALYERLGKTNLNQPLRVRETSLDQLIKRRAAMDKLMGSDASNKEIMLAVGLMDTDPTLVDELLAKSNKQKDLDDKIATAKAMMEASAAIKSLRESPIPSFAPDEIDAGKNVLRKAIIQLTAGLSAPDSRDVQIHGTAAGREKQILDDLNIPTSIPREKKSPVGKGAAPTDNADVYKFYQKVAQQSLDAYVEADKLLKSTVERLGKIILLLQKHDISVADLAPHSELTKYLIDVSASPAKFGVQRAKIDAAFDADALSRELDTLLNDKSKGFKNPIVLKSTEEHKSEYDALQEQRKKILTSGGKAELGGSDDCWKIVQKSLEKQGLRPEEVKAAILHMQSRADLSQDISKEVSRYALQEFPIVPGSEDEIQDAWHKDPARKQYADFFEKKFKSSLWAEYGKALFRRNPDAIGMRLTDNPRTMPIQTVEKAYFITKHLYNLPSDDPRKLPQNPDVNSFLRKCHRALLDKAQSDMIAKGELTHAERKLKEGATEASDPKRRIEMANQVYFQNTDKISKYGAAADRISTKFFEPHKKELERRTWAGLAIGGTLWAGKTLFVGGKDKFAAGMSEAYKGAKTDKGKHVLKRTAQVAAMFSALGPPGMLIGAGIGAAVGAFTSPSKSGDGK
jgi:hypothetical protein